MPKAEEVVEDKAEKADKEGEPQRADEEKEEGPPGGLPCAPPLCASLPCLPRVPPSPATLVRLPRLPSLRACVPSMPASLACHPMLHSKVVRASRRMPQRKSRRKRKQVCVWGSRSLHLHTITFSERAGVGIKNSSRKATVPTRNTRTSNSFHGYGCLMVWGPLLSGRCTRRQSSTPSRLRQFCLIRCIKCSS